MIRRYKVTLPSVAGNKITVSATGYSVTIEKAPLYLAPEDVPYFQFGSNPPDQYIYPKSVYSVDSACSKPFPNLTFYSTSASVGDIIYILVSDTYQPDSITINNTVEATAGTTFFVTTNDTVQVITTSQYTDSSGNLAKSMLVSINGYTTNNRLRFAFGVNPVQAGNGHVLDAIDDTIRIDGIDFIKNFRFINDVNGTNFTVSLTMEF